MGAFGEKLRKQREQRNIALDAISNTTKISTRMLRALEDENFDQLPGGVFNKGFVRAYARQVGLNEEEAIADYLAALRESQIQSHKILPDFRNSAANPFEVAVPDSPQHGRRNDDSARVRDTNFPNNAPQNNAQRNNAQRDNPLKNPAAAAIDGGKEFPQSDRRRQSRRNEDRRDNTTNAAPRQPVYSSMPIFTTGTLGEIQPDSADKPPARIPWGKLAAVLILVSATLAFWNLRRQSHLTAASPSPAPSSQTAPAVAAPVATSYQPSSAEASPKIRQTSPATTSSGAIASATPPITARTSAIPPQPVASASSKPAATIVPPSPNNTAASPNNAAASTTAKAVPQIPAAKPPATFTLLIRADKTTWVSIIADGKPIAEETLIAPAHTSVRATQEIVVRAGNAGGISFLLNAKEIPSQGNEGEVRTYIFDSSGMKISAAQAPTTAPQP